MKLQKLLQIAPSPAKSRILFPPISCSQNLQLALENKLNKAPTSCMFRYAQLTMFTITACTHTCMPSLTVQPLCELCPTEPVLYTDKGTIVMHIIVRYSQPVICHN